MSDRTTKSYLQLLALLFALAVPMIGCGREDETEIETPDGEVEVETEREMDGDTEVETERDNADLGEDLEDAGITAKVKTRLASDERVSAFDVDVDARQGVVTLEGSVGEEEAKSAAEEIARATEGVSGVVNRITVGSGESSAT